jgi:hypothetical protein
MPEMVLNVSSLQETLFTMIPTKRVKLRQNDGVISLIPFKEVTEDECPLLGIAVDSTLTVDKFLAMTREDKLLEGLEI